MHSSSDPSEGRPAGHEGTLVGRPGSTRRAPPGSLEMDEGAPDEAVTFGQPLPTEEPAVDSPSEPPPPEPPAERAADHARPPLLDVTGRGLGGEFEVQRLLARGAMGQVHLAWQRSMGREVAIKVPSFGRNRRVRIDELVREARAMGRLEHPNIVPVHALGQTPDGALAMVMKRIDGVTWRAVADGRAPMPERFRTEDPLEGHLRILMEVCDAVHFAHGRGVLHRDLKLDNVMLGPNGEVYVLDWGLAVALDPAIVDLPAARDVRGLAGTPSYMAPEMARGDGHQLGPASDVFCLGALLHRLVVGRPRYDEATVREVLDAARVAAPFDYSQVERPLELTAICARATAVDPGARYPDVQGLRRAVAAYLEHRVAWKLIDEGRRARAAMSASDEYDTIGRHFAVARFAFEQAAHVWPDNADAPRLLDELVVDRAEIAFGRGRLEYAEELLGTLEPGPSTAERISTLRERLEARRLDARKREVEVREVLAAVDPRVNSRARGLVVLALGLLWSANTARRQFDLPDPARLAAEQSVVALATGLTFYLGRSWAWATRFNRRLVLAVMMLVLTHTGLRTTAAMAGLDGPTTMVFELVVDFFMLALLTVFADRRLWVALPVSAVGWLVALYHPQWGFLVKAAHIVATLSVLAFWWVVLPARGLKMPGEGAGDAD